MRILLPVVFMLVAVATVILTVTAIAMFAMNQIGPGLAAVVGGVITGLMTRSLWKQLTAA